MQTPFGPPPLPARQILVRGIRRRDERTILTLATLQMISRKFNPWIDVDKAPLMRLCEYEPSDIFLHARLAVIYEILLYTPVIQIS